MSNLVREAEEKLRSSKIDCIYFDGKKDLSKVRLEVDGSDKVFHGMRNEEHVSVCSSNGGYLTHFTPGESSKKTPAAKDVANNILRFRRYRTIK